MRSPDLKPGRAARAAFAALGVAALTVSGFVFSDTAAYAESSVGVGGGGGSANASGTVGSGGGTSARASADVNGGRGSGGERNSEIAATFESLSRPQQARVMQRCKEVLAAPAQADANQVSLCQTLSMLAKH